MSKYQGSVNINLAAEVSYLYFKNLNDYSLVDVCFQWEECPEDNNIEVKLQMRDVEDLEYQDIDETLFKTLTTQSGTFYFQLIAFCSNDLRVVITKSGALIGNIKFSTTVK